MVLKDEIPEWAKQGPIDLKNYNYRVMWHGQTKKWGDGWPMLTLKTQNFMLWHEYFFHHLGGFPWAFQMLMDGKIKQMNIPEARPEWFDPSFIPTPGYRAPTKPEDNFSPEYRTRMAKRFEKLLADLRQGRLSRDSGEAGKASPGIIFSNFDEAFRRHGRARSQNEISLPPRKG